MCGDPGPQRLGLLRLPDPAQDGRRQECADAEMGERQRMSRHAEDRLGRIGEQVVEVVRRMFEDATPPLAVAVERFDRAIQRSVQHARRTVVERMGAVDRRLQPREAVRREVELGEERRRGGDRMDGRAVVMDQAGDDHLRAARATADRIARLEHRHVHAGAGQPRRGGEPVRPAADDDRRCQVVTGTHCPNIDRAGRERDAHGGAR